MSAPTDEEMVGALRVEITILEAKPAAMVARQHIAALRACLERLEASRWRDRVIDALSKRVLDSRRIQDWRVVIVGFATPEDALEFHEAISALPSPPATTSEAKEDGE